MPDRTAIESVRVRLFEVPLPEVMTDRTIIEMAPELIVVADHTKFGKVASAYIAPVERITTLVTDPETDRETLARLREMGVHVIVADPAS